MDLTRKKCKPCGGGTPPLGHEETERLLKQTSEWHRVGVNGVYAIERTFKFKDFAEARVFVNKVAAVAEEEGHHPDIKISWNNVTLQLTTHAIKGLSENDFIMAAKIDTILS